MAKEDHNDLRDSRFKDLDDYVERWEKAYEMSYEGFLPTSNSFFQVSNPDAGKIVVGGILPEADRVVQEVKDIIENNGWPDLKYDERKYIEEITNYIKGTYGEHYSKGDVQTFELLMSSGKAEGFTTGSIIKYADRYGKKDGHNRKDILKIIHYGMLLLYVHDKAGRK